MPLIEPSKPYKSELHPLPPPNPRGQFCWGIIVELCQQFSVSVPIVFLFYANEDGELRHIHIQREKLLAKFWLNPVSLANSVGFSAHELSKLLSMVEANHQTFVEAWNEFFGA